ncbi:N-acetyltransferase O1 (Establishment of cohesion protein 1) [Orbilia blumenaviensis]|uniref:N-acetyltransferase O1 (Establishment of cohesion protein 1) n=1 Tax=Orbilia blumenaviensis TaxID=1796055 RepID=A0AAV9U5Q1_9PEZI
MSSSSPAIARIRKRTVVTYSKKSRTYIGAGGSAEDTSDLQVHDSKRIRIAEPDGEDEETDSIKSDRAESLEPASTAGTTADEEEEEDGLNPEKETMPSVTSLQVDPEARAVKGDTVPSTSTKITGFTISTRRKPLFKRHITKKTSDTLSSPPSASSTPASTQSSTSTVSSSSTIKSQKPKLVQMQIDLDGIGAPKISCKECGMQYVPSADEDAKLHKRYHAQVVEGLEFGNSRGKVVWEGKLEGKAVEKRRGSVSGKKDMGKAGTAASGTTTGEKENLTPITRFFASGRGEKTASGKKLPLAGRDAVPSSTSTTCYVIEITRRSTPTEKKKAVEFLRFANKELSAQEVAENVLWGSSASGSNDVETDKGEHFKIYLYLEGTKCVGLCLAEKIKEAQWATIKEGSASISCSLDISETKRPALLGISRIWTCPKHRRHGVASRLVNSAVESFVYGMKVQAGMVAFSQPTDSGAWFALGWVNGQMTGENSRENSRESDAGIRSGFLVYLDGV